MPVEKSTLPATSNLWTLYQGGDFLDCYSCRSDLPARPAADLAMQMPTWANALLTLRNRIVAPLGLRTEFEQNGAMFPVTYDTENELNMGFDDSHLNFRITVMQDHGRVYMATWVHRNNWIGRVYLAAVMPFHILMSRSAVAQIAKGTP